MTSTPVFQNLSQLKDLISELSQQLGPDHPRVQSLKRDLVNRSGPEQEAPFPASAMSAAEVNDDHDATRDTLESAERREIAEANSENAEAAATRQRLMPS